MQMGVQISRACTKNTHTHTNSMQVLRAQVSRALAKDIEYTTAHPPLASTQGSSSPPQYSGASHILQQQHPEVGVLFGGVGVLYWGVGVLYLVYFIGGGRRSMCARMHLQAAHWCGLAHLQWMCVYFCAVHVCEHAVRVFVPSRACVRARLLLANVRCYTSPAVSYD